MIDGRFERKFLVEDLELAEIESLVHLHPAHFTRPYAPRHVNNVYFDSADFSSFRANVDGVAARTKLRIRWYGDLFGRIERPVLERKSKAGLLGTKDSFRLPPLDMAPGVSAADMRSALTDAGLPDELLDYVRVMEPALLNRYRRSYHLSGDGKFRLTIDSELEFRPFDRLGSSFLHTFTEPVVVVEIKYDQRHDREAEHISSAFPFRLTKSSKYVSGIERLLA